MVVSKTLWTLLAASLCASGAMAGEKKKTAAKVEAAEAAATPKPSSWPDDAEVQAARDAYNSKDFEDAVQRFVGIAQRHPTNAMVYLGLARSSAMAKDPTLAVIAYRFYLTLSVDDVVKEKAKAEMDNQSKKAKAQPPPGPPAASAAQVEAALEAGRAGQFLGPNGAFGLFDASLAAGYINPKMAQVRSAIDGLISEASDAAIADWWATDRQLSASRLAELSGAWAERERRGGTQTAQSVAMRGALDGLIKLFDQEYAVALDILGRVAAGDSRLRFAQSLALYRAGRHAEAEGLLADLSPREEDPRFAILLGWVQAAKKKKSAGQTLKAALLD